MAGTIGMIVEMPAGAVAGLLGAYFVLATVPGALAKSF
jgi:hypothetical protein